MARTKKANYGALPYGGTNEIAISEDGEITTSIYANTEGVICTWTTQGYKPKADEIPEWLEKFLDPDGAVRGSW